MNILALQVKPSNVQNAIGLLSYWKPFYALNIQNAAGLFKFLETILFYALNIQNATGF